MEYITPPDYAYITNKYHDTSKPFNSYCRFIRRDEIFPPESGLDGDEIKKQLLLEDGKIQELPHPIRKAKAFEFVLKNTRISCDKRDIFPAINAIDRPLNDTIIAEWRKEVFTLTLPNLEEKRSQLEMDGIVTILPDYDHSVPIWDRIFSLGFYGILQESEKARIHTTKTQEQNAFFEGIKITYTAILQFLERLERQANKDGNTKLETALCNVRQNPPKTFYEALLVDYLYFILSEHVEGLQVRSLGNFDRLFYPFYQNDLNNGVSEEELRKDLAYFLLQFTAIDNYWNQPVFLGGCKENEETEINLLSYTFLDVYDKMGIFNPKIQIKVADSTPKDFLLKGLDMIRRGNNSIVFVSDKTIRTALMKRGIDKNAARLCNVKGCYEYSVQGGTDLGMNYLNLLKPLEYALHEGNDGLTGVFSGRKSPSIDRYKTFEEFYDEYKKQLVFIMNNTIQLVNSFEGYLAYINPQSMLSATYPTCLKTGKDALVGGSAVNDSLMAFGATANIADSLTIIKKYVFDKKELSLEKLRDMLDSNYANDEIWRLRFFNDEDKFGNNKDLPDFFAKDIVDFTTAYLLDKDNAPKRGGKWISLYHTARCCYTHGVFTAASPDGRKKGEELSKNLSASMGQNKKGATAAILSITKIDATQFPSDAALDLGLLPSSVRGSDGLQAMHGLLMTFVKRGGHALHINVFDADTLRDAQAHPEKYQDLQIRVCGWNVLWNNINKEEQDGFIKQAESLI